MKKSQFLEEGTFYKGNIHSHTTRSDGTLSPEKAVELYREKGYSFIVLSDHDKLFDSERLDSSDFLVYPGIEWSVNQNHGTHLWQDILGIYNGEGLGKEMDGNSFPPDKYMKPLEGKSLRIVQQAIDMMRASGLMPIYNHPRISRVEPEDILALENLFAIEIYNNKSEVYCGNGVATDYWDWLLRRGKKLYAVATDDNHNQESDSPFRDSFGGWIVVKSKELSRASLAEALRKGSFYSSTGPEIYDITIDQGKVHIKTSPVKHIKFIPYALTEPNDVYRASYGRNFTSEPGSFITEAQYELSGSEVYIRVECEDEEGRIAWSNPFFEEDLVNGGEIDVLKERTSSETNKR